MLAGSELIRARLAPRASSRLAVGAAEVGHEAVALEGEAELVGDGFGEDLRVVIEVERVPGEELEDPLEAREAGERDGEAAAHVELAEVAGVVRGVDAGVADDDGLVRAGGLACHAVSDGDGRYGVGEMPDAQGLKVAPTRVEPEDRDPVDVEFVGQCVQDGLDDAADGSVEEDGGVEVVDGSETRELALEPAVELGGPALGMDAFGDVLRDDQPRLGSVERQAVRGDVDVDGGAILERVDPDPFVAVSVVGALFEVRQELGPVSGRSDVGKPHGEERVLAVAVALHHGVVDSEESERGGVVDVHRQGVALEQVAEGVFARLESLFGGASRADVLLIATKWLTVAVPSRTGVMVCSSW